MLKFALGFIAGVGVSGLAFVILAFFRAGIEKRLRIIETKAASVGPKPTGAIFVPDDEGDARKAIIKRNQRMGRDTKLSELP